MKRRSLRVPAASAGAPLARFVGEALGVAETEARALVDRGAVYVQGRRAREGGLALAEGQVVLVVLEEAGRAALDEAPPPSPLVVLFEDDALLVVAKPVGITAQPTPSRTGDSLLDLASRHLGRPAGLVHRLDRETSGLTVFGKTPEATSALAAEFREGRARKRYLAATGPGLAPSGTIDLPLSRDPSRPGRWRASRAANGIEAQTDFVRLHASDALSLVALFPKTGRTHQLRAHLTALGLPIAGDRLYGGPRTLSELPVERCLLHAQALQLRHPLSGAPLCLEAPVPADLSALFAQAGVAVPQGPW